MKLDLDHLRVVVTAAGAGIGRATAELLVGTGARVFVCDIDADSLVAVTGHAGIDGVVADVGDTASVDAFMAAAVDKLGGVDVLVNNAGIAGPGGRVDEVEPADVTHTLDVNVTSMFRTSRHVIPLMVEQRSGLIVNIASTAGYLGVGSTDVVDA